MYIRMAFSSSVIVPIVDENCVLAIEREDHSPVAVHFHRPVASEFPLEGVKMPTGHVHRGGSGRAIQNYKLALQLVCVSRLNTNLRSSLKELFQPGVPERLDHFLYRKLRIYSCQLQPRVTSPLLLRVELPLDATHRGEARDEWGTPHLRRDKRQLRRFWTSSRMTALKIVAECGTGYDGLTQGRRHCGRATCFKRRRRGRGTDRHPG